MKKIKVLRHYNILVKGKVQRVNYRVFVQSKENRCTRKRNENFDESTS